MVQRSNYPYFDSAQKQPVLTDVHVNRAHAFNRHAEHYQVDIVFSFYTELRETQVDVELMLPHVRPANNSYGQRTASHCSATACPSRNQQCNT